MTRTWSWPGPTAVAVRVQFLHARLCAAGRDRERGLVAPEMQLANEALNTSVTNYFYTRSSCATRPRRVSASTIIIIDIADEVAAAGNADALVALHCRQAAGWAHVADAAPPRHAMPRFASRRASRRRASPRRSISSRLRRNSRCSASGNRYGSMSRRRFLRALSAGGALYAFGRTPGTVWAQSTGVSGFTRLQGAGLRVPRRWQRFLEHARAALGGGIRGVCEFPPEPRNRAGRPPAGAATESRTVSSSVSIRRCPACATCWSPHAAR